MNRREIVLAALAAGEKEKEFEPVHVQKLLFLVDEELGEDVDGPHFDFRPYDYGPFDKAVYEQLEALAEEGLVDIDKNQSTLSKSYQLTGSGQAAANAILAEIEEGDLSFLSLLSDWVRDQSFSDLVSAIYKSYPEMKENSVFSDS